MKRILFALIILLLPALAQAAGGAVHLDKIHLDFSNKSSLQRGMATYVNNCLACHSLKYQRYQRTAEDLEIPLDLMKKHLIPGPLGWALKPLVIRLRRLWFHIVSGESRHQWRRGRWPFPQ